MTLNPYNVTNYADAFIMTLIDYSPKLISAFVILFLGFYVIRVEDNKELVICGDLALDYCSKINSLYLPNVVLAGTDNTSNLPF